MLHALMEQNVAPTFSLKGWRQVGHSG